MNAQTATGTRIGLVIATAAALGALGGCVAANMTAKADLRLLGLIERLVEGDRTASIVSVGIVAATAILSALAIPAMTLYAITKHERDDRQNEDENYLGPACRNCLLAAQGRMVTYPDHRRSKHINPASRSARELSHSTGPDRRALGSQAPGHDSAQKR